jgi:hypothetical protein
MTCVHCDSKPIEVGMTVTDGRQLTLRSCCRPQWFCDGEAVAFSTVVHLIPKRRRRASRHSG